MLGDITSRFVQQPRVAGATGKKGNGKKKSVVKARKGAAGNFEYAAKSLRREPLQSAVVPRQPSFSDFGRSLAAVR